MLVLPSSVLCMAWAAGERRRSPTCTTPYSSYLVYDTIDAQDANVLRVESWLYIQRRIDAMDSTLRPSRNDLQLRNVEHRDLPIFLEHQQDPDAMQMAAFSATDWTSFMAHWTTMLATTTVINQTILVNGEVAGLSCVLNTTVDEKLAIGLANRSGGTGVPPRRSACS